MATNVRYRSKRLRRLSSALPERHFPSKENYQATRQDILLSCYANSLPPREPFIEPRGYLDERSWYTTCTAPLPEEDEYISAALISTSIAITPAAVPPPEPPDPLEPSELAPCDSGCNLPITNPQTVEHFKLTTVRTLASTKVD